MNSTSVKMNPVESPAKTRVQGGVSGSRVKMKIINSKKSLASEFRIKEQEKRLAAFR